MVQENLTPEDLDLAISETTKVPDFLNANISLKFQRFGGFPEVAWRSFWIKNEEDKIVHFIFRPFIYPGYAIIFNIFKMIKNYSDPKTSY